MSYSEAANNAVNQVLIRSLNTTIIGVLPVAALLFAGVFVLGSVVYLARQLRRRGPLVQSLVASAPHSWGVRLHPVW